MKYTFKTGDLVKSLEKGISFIGNIVNVVTTYDGYSGKVYRVSDGKYSREIKDIDLEPVSIPKFKIGDVVITKEKKIAVIKEIDTDRNDCYYVNIANTDEYHWVPEYSIHLFTNELSWTDIQRKVTWSDTDGISSKIPVYSYDNLDFWKSYMKLFAIAEVLNNGWRKTYSNEGYVLNPVQTVRTGEYNQCAGTIYFKTKDIAYQAKEMLTDEEFNNLFDHM